jgi:hypothetical protein
MNAAPRRVLIALCLQLMFDLPGVCADAASDASQVQVQVSSYPITPALASFMPAVPPRGWKAPPLPLTRTPKDPWALSIAFAAFVVAVFTFLQKRDEARVGFRKQLTDLLEKLNAANKEYAVYQIKKEAFPDYYGRLLTDQKRFGFGRRITLG